MNDSRYDPGDLVKVPEPEWKEYRSRIDRYLDGYRAFKALEASLRLGLFEALAVPADPETVAARIDADPAMTGLLCASLAETGFIEEHDGVCSLTPGTETYLTEDSPHCQKDAVLRSAERASRWENLDRLVLGGPEVVSQEEHFNADWIKAIATESKGGSIGKVVGYIEEHAEIPETGTITDVGGGHGLYMIALCARHPGLRGRVFDRRRILAVAERHCEEYGVPLELVPGDLYEDPIPGGNDLMYIAFNPGDSDPDLVPNISDALSPGGTLIVRRHTRAATQGALRNLEWNLRIWEGFKPGGRRHSAAATDNGEKYIERLATAGVELVSREDFDRESEMLVFRKAA